MMKSPALHALFALLCALLSALLSAAAPASARDATITSDPLAAATMPPPSRERSMFIPYYTTPGGRDATFEMPREMVDPDRFPTRGLVPRTAQMVSRVHTLTPQNNAIFPKNSMVSLSWLPTEQVVNDDDLVSKAQYPIRYEVIISRHDLMGQRVYIKEQPGLRQYVHLFSPPGAGRYHWYVRAVYDKAMHGYNSDVRSFLVLP